MLWDEDGITQKELTSRLFKDQPTTTRMLDKLENKGIIRREDAADDRRAFLIYLTEEGREMRNALYPIILDLRDDTWRGFTTDEMAIFMNMLDRIWDNLE
jgi:DNA-binding MarR family transcriptional regulator